MSSLAFATLLRSDPATLQPPAPPRPDPSWLASSAGELAGLIHSRTLTSEAVVAAHLARITVKDSFDTEGLVSTGGTLGRKGFVPTADATIVQRLKAAGAIVIGKTNTPELTLAYEANNLIDGMTHNPCDLARGTGGSSGGASAIVAAWGSPLDVRAWTHVAAQGRR